MTFFRPATALLFVSLSFFLSLVPTNASGLTISETLLLYGKSLYKDSPDSARSIIEYIKEFSKEKNEIPVLAEAYFLEGNLLRRVEKNNEEALVSYYNALNYYYQLDNEKGIVKALRGLGLSYRYSYNFKLALEYFKEELMHEEVMGMTLRVSETYHNLGYCFRRLEKYDSAKYYLEKSIQIKTEAGNSEGLLNSYLALGTCYEQKNNYSEKLRYHNKALTLAKELKNSKKTAIILHNIGALELVNDHTESALSYFKRALGFPEYVQDDAKIIYNYESLGELYLRKGDEDSAMYYYQKALSLDPENTDIYVLHDIYRFVRDYYESVGDFEVAFGYSKKLDESLAPLTQRFKQQEERSLAFKTELIHAEYLRTQLYIETQNAKHERDILRLLIVIGVLIIMIVGYLVVRLYKKGIILKGTLQNLKERDVILNKAFDLYNNTQFAELTRLFDEYRYRKKK